MGWRDTAWVASKAEDGFGESEQMCLGTFFWSRFGELGGNGGDMGDVGSRVTDHPLRVWKWIAGERGGRRGRGQW